MNIVRRSLVGLNIAELCRKMAIAFYGIITVAIMYIVLFRSGLTYMCKIVFDMPNIVLLCIMALLVGTLCYLYWRFQSKLISVLARISGKGIWVAAAVLFLLQILICWNIYFMTGWDVGGYVLPAAQALARGEALDGAFPMLSQYPNNLFIIYFFSKVMKVCGFFGISDASGQLFALIVVNCLISSLSSVMLFRSIQEMTKKNVLAWAGWILFVILVGFSPWMVIPYSDSVGLVFPILMWYLYTKVKKEGGGRCIVTYECVCLMGVIGVVGYFIKPQLIVIVIAIVIGEFIALIDSKQKTSIFAPGYRMCFLMGILMALLLYMHLPSSMGLELDRNAKIGMPHFFMMGLNESTNGIYSTEDVLYTSQFATQAERNAADLAMARERINKMGIVGLSHHLVKKTLVNYNDGTFAWGMEGTFYAELYPDKNKIFSPFCKSFFYNNEQGTHRHYLATIQHMAWLFVLAASLGILRMLKKKEVGMYWILVMALAGIFLFECLFEARARYLYTYVPIFIMVALLGLDNLYAMGRRVLRMLTFFCKAGKGAGA